MVIEALNSAAPVPTVPVRSESGGCMPGTSSCVRCGGPLVTITFSVEGAPRTMQSCSGCDNRTWLAGSTPIALDGVLAELSDVRRAPFVSRR
jgi:hypothetical protein